MPFSYVGGNSSSGYGVSADIVHGLTISEGDLLVVHVNRNDEKLISSTSGGTSWNEAIQVMPPPTETASQAVYWKVAGASEPASYSFELNVLSGSEDEYAITIHQFSVTGGTPQIELAATSNHNATSSPDLVVQAHAGRVNPAGSLSIVAAGKDREQAAQTWTAVSEGFLGIQGSGDGRSTATAYKIHSAEETINNDVVFTSSGATGSDATYSIHLSFSIAGADTTAPILSSPTGSSTGSTTADGTVTTDEGNGTLYYYASQNSSELASTIKASGSSQSVSTSGVQNVSFTGLTASTTYYAHYVQDDAATNESNVVSSTSFTTDAPAFSITPSTTTPTEGDTVTVTIGQGTGPYTATLNGDALTIDSQNATSATITWPDLKVFGTKNQSYETAYALVFTDTNDSDTDSVNMTTQIPVGHYHATLTATTGIYADDVGVAIGDKAYGYWVSGSGSADLTVGALNSGPGGTFRYWIQDDTDSLWGTSADEVLPATNAKATYTATTLRLGLLPQVQTVYAGRGDPTTFEAAANFTVTAQLGSNTGSQLEASCNYSMSSGMANGGAGQLQAATDYNVLADMIASKLADIGASVGVSTGFADSGIAARSIEAGATNTISISDVTANDSNVEVSCSYNVANSMSNSGLGNLQGSATYDVISDALVSTIQAIEAAANNSIGLNITSIAGRDLEESVTFSTTNSLGVTSDLTIDGDCAFSVGLNYLCSSLVEVEASADYNTLVQLVAATAGTLDAQATFDISSDISVSRSITTDAGATINITAVMTTAGSTSVHGVITTPDHRVVKIVVSGGTVQVL